MRLVFVGAGDLAMATVEGLIHRNHEIIVVESDRKRIDQVSENSSSSFLYGDGTTPSILKEAGPEATDILFCMTGSDQANIIASLVGRSLGYKKIITRIQDPQFESICNELRLDNVIIPDRTISRYLQDLVRDVDIIELSTVLKGDVRLLSFQAGEEEAGQVSELGLPEKAKAVFLYRDDTFVILDEDSEVKKGDEVILITHSRNLRSLRDRWNPRESAETGS